MKELSVEKQIYLCKYHDIDDALNVTLGISRSEAQEILSKLKSNGMYDQYRKLSEDEYEKIIHTEERKDKFERILDKYNFDKESTRYSIIKDVLIEAQADKKILN